MHCADPACATVCPAGAITKGEAGIVSVNPDRCIGCKYCYQACPFSVPQYNSQSMVKCDCCLGNGVKPGETPHCAEACNFGALHFGMVSDLLEKCPDAVVVDASTAPSPLSCLAQEELSSMQLFKCAKEIKVWKDYR